MVPTGLEEEFRNIMIKGSFVESQFCHIRFMGPNATVCIWVLVFVRVRLFVTDPTDCSPPGSSSCGIFQARMLEWAATSCSIRVCVFGSERKMRVNISNIQHSSQLWNRTAAWTRVPLPVTSVVFCVSEFPVLGWRLLNLSCCCRVCVCSVSHTLWPHHGLQFMESSKQEYWSRLPFPTPGDLPDWGRSRVHTCFSWVSLHAHFPPLHHLGIPSVP